MANIAPAVHERWELARAACPKHMTHGPCAGVTDDGACEIPLAGPCPYVGDWPFPSTARASSERLGKPFILTDLPAAPPDTAGLRSAARLLAGSADAFLLGDHGCVPVATDAFSAAVLASFASDRLPPGYLAHIYEAPDPRDAGIAAAVDLARRMLAHPGVDGVNLSGGTQAGYEPATARDLATIGRELR